MNPKYAFFIWASYGLAAAAVLWNLIAPHRRRNELLLRLSDAPDTAETLVETDGPDGAHAGVNRS